MAQLKKNRTNTGATEMSDDDVSEMDQLEDASYEDSEDDLEAMIKAKSLQSDDELSS